MSSSHYKKKLKIGATGTLQFLGNIVQQWGQDIKVYILSQPEGHPFDKQHLLNVRCSLRLECVTSKSKYNGGKGYNTLSV